MRLLFDLETDGLLDTVTTIHSLVIYNLDENRLYSYTDHDCDNYNTIQNGLDYLQLATTLYGHNIISYDLEVLKKLYPNISFCKRKIDTLNLSRLIYPEITTFDYGLWKHIPPKLKGRHSLEAWGHRLSSPDLGAACYLKDSFGKSTDWKEWSQEMQDYCEQDVLLNVKLLEHLLAQNPSQESIDIEMRFQEIITQQEKNGCPFDKEKAIEIFNELSKRSSEIEAELKAMIPDQVIETVFVPKVNNLAKGYYKGVPIVRQQVIPFNPGSRQQIEEFFKKKYNWQPTVLTEKGNTTIDSDVLASVDFPEAKLLSEYFDLHKVMGRLSGSKAAWLDNVRGNRCYGSQITNGTPTARCTHRVIANVPKASSFMGKELRSLFLTGLPGYKAVGADASRLELVTFAHYLAAYDGGEYAREVESGDIHTKNQIAFGLKSRDEAKTAIYCCVTMDTQILTKRGWLKYEEVQIGDIALTYNSEKEVKEWKPVLEKVYYEDAEVIEMSHSHTFKVKTTPNHRWFCKKRRDGGRGGRYYEKQVVTTENIHSEHSIITNAKMSPDIGWGVNADKLHALPKFKTDWVGKVLMMNSNQRKLFLQGFLLADGYQRASFKRWIWNQNKNNIAEGLLVASYIEHDGNLYINEPKGKNSKMYQVNMSKRGTVTGQRLKKIKLDNQPVWCIRTENESFVMRQGNAITITGNTLYGGGDMAIGQTIAPGLGEAAQRIAGKKAKDSFCRAIPAYAQLVKDVQYAAKQRGFLKGLDGRKIPVRSAHSALNALLQSAGAILMKKANIIFWDKMEARGIMLGDERVQQAIQYHDEIDIMVDSTIAKEISEELAQSIRDAGTYFKLACKLDATAKIGNNWYDIH